jgi:hypothetical protein
MQQSEMEKLLSALGATAEIMGTEMQPANLMIMADDLSEYSLNDILIALRRCRREMSGKLTLAAIIDRIQSSDGMLGADEAWALVSKPETETFVMTDEMAKAMGVARPVLNDGDKVGARMAFKDAYTRLVQEARENHIKPHWFVSLGHDKEGRAQPIAEAIRTGKISLNHSLSLLGPDEKAEVLQLTGNDSHPFLLEYKQAQLEDQKPLDVRDGMKRIAELKNKLNMRKSA